MRDFADAGCRSTHYLFAEASSDSRWQLGRVVEPIVRGIDRATGPLRGRVQMPERRWPNRVTRRRNDLYVLGASTCDIHLHPPFALTPQSDTRDHLSTGAT